MQFPCRIKIFLLTANAVFDKENKSPLAEKFLQTAVLFIAIGFLQSLFSYLPAFSFAQMTTADSTAAGSKDTPP